MMIVTVDLSAVRANFERKAYIELPHISLDD